MLILYSDFKFYCFGFFLCKKITIKAHHNLDFAKVPKKQLASTYGPTSVSVILTNFDPAFLPVKII